MENTLISFMAKLTPEMLKECATVLGASGSVVGSEEQLRREVDLTAITIREVRAAEAALAPKKPGRPKGSRRKVEVQA